MTKTKHLDNRKGIQTSHSFKQFVCEERRKISKKRKREKKCQNATKSATAESKVIYICIYRGRGKREKDGEGTGSELGAQSSQQNKERKINK